MRITTETLLKLAKDTVSQRLRQERDILGAYLQGSVLNEPLLGGTADIDLFFVHSDDPAQEREIVRLTDEVHLDIAHHARRLYSQARELRHHAWLGYAINGGKLLYDPQHFLDFTQASVRGQFDRPETILGRARPLSEHARQIWLAFQQSQQVPGPAEMAKYLRSLDHAANAVATLSGPPLTERRFLLNFPERALAVGHPGLYAGLLGLLGGPQVDAAVLKGWLADWQAAYQEAPTPPARLHPYRLHYFLRAFEAILESDHPHDLLWPMWRTWTQAANCFAPDSSHYQSWQTAGERLGLLGSAFQQRIEALDAFLDTIEELLEDWASKHGA